MSKSPRTSLRLKCPHCGSQARIRTSYIATEITRIGYIDCTDVEKCGWRGQFSIGYTGTMVQSLNPNPAISLPVTPTQRAQ